MSISSTSSLSAASSSITQQASRSHPRPDRREALASALGTIGVGDETAASVLSQVQEAVDAVKSGSSQNERDSAAVRSAIASVLEQNGIDPKEVGDAIRDSRATEATEQSLGTQRSGATQQTGGPGRGRPNGPPPPRTNEKGEVEVGSVESALLAANVDESDIDELLTQLIESISELTSDEDIEVNAEGLRKALTDVLSENGVDVDLFELAFQDELGATGTFFNRVV